MSFNNKKSILYSFARCMLWITLLVWQRSYLCFMLCVSVILYCLSYHINLIAIIVIIIIIIFAIDCSSFIGLFSCGVMFLISCRMKTHTINRHGVYAISRPIRSKNLIITKFSTGSVERGRTINSSVGIIIIKQLACRRTKGNPTRHVAW